MKNKKKTTLDKIAYYHSSNKKRGFTYGWEDMYELYKKYRFISIKKYLKGDSVLEIGPAEGDMTNMLVRHFRNVSVLEGSGKFVRELKKRFKNKITIHEDLIENFQGGCKYDIIIMSHMLEHLNRPAMVLKRVSTWMGKRGRLIIIVPNSESIHRYIGVKLGMLRKVDELNNIDVKIGHKRVYNPVRLRKTVETAGLTVESFGGIFIKPFSNRQMVKICSDEMLKAFFELGNTFPQIACEIFVVCISKGA